MAATNEEPCAQKAAILGAGAFGTALAQLMARQGYRAVAWTRSADVADAINSTHENLPYLPGIELSEFVTATTDVDEATAGADIVFVVVPTQFVRAFIMTHRDSMPVGAPIVVCCKGVETATLLTPFEILEEELPGKYHRSLACLSGPSFAREVAEGKPTSVTVAARSLDVARRVQRTISDRFFRAYVSDDVVGVELFGAVKNILAIACGASDGFEFGLNARAALITRGLAEISRLAVRKGASPLSMGGLCGVGDLVLTCTGSLSRNWTVGNRMACGEPLPDILHSMRQVAEGVKTAESVHELCQKEGINMPICEEVYQVLFNGKSITDALGSLQDRPLADDFHLEMGGEMDGGAAAAAAATPAAAAAIGSGAWAFGARRPSGNALGPRSPGGR
ncbi:unnamed protein product [Phaeothamnion confervicola]